MAAVRHLRFLKVRNVNCWSGSEGQYASSCISLDRKFVTDQTVTRAELRHRAKFSWNRWNCGRDMAIFRFSKWRHGVLSLQNSNSTVLTVGRIISVELRYRAKFVAIGQNVVEISRFWIFQDGGSHHLGFLKFYTFNDPNGQERRTASLRQILSKSLKPGWMSVFDFSRWRPTPSWIFGISNFNCRDGQEGQTASSRQISSKSLKPRLRYSYFSIFQDVGRCHLKFSKFPIFNVHKGQEGRTASARQTSSKSVKPQPKYGDLSIFPKKV